jgi:hypothetical protein
MILLLHKNGPAISAIETSNPNSRGTECVSFDSSTRCIGRTAAKRVVQKFEYLRTFETLALKRRTPEKLF